MKNIWIFNIWWSQFSQTHFAPDPSRRRTASTSSVNPSIITSNITTRSASALLRTMITSSGYMEHIALIYYGNS